MQNVKTKEKKRLHGFPEKAAGALRGMLPGAARFAAYGAAGFLFAGVSFEETGAPLAPAFCAAAPGLAYVPASLGTALGAVVFFDGLQALRLAAGAALVFLLRLAAEGAFRVGRQALVCGLQAFLAVLLTGMAVSFAAGADAAALLLEICRGAVAFAAACLFYRALLLLPERGALAAALPFDRAALLFTGAALLLALDRLRAGTFSPAHALGFFAVLSAAQAGKEAYGVIAGVAAGAAFGFPEDGAFLLAALPLGGLLSGLAACCGRLAAVGAFAAAYLTGMMLLSDSLWFVPRIAELALAAAVFLLLPRSRASRLSARWFPGSPEPAPAAEVFLRLRLQNVAAAVRGVSALMTAARKLSPAKPAPALSPMEACEACGKFAFCFGEAAPLTAAAFSEAAEIYARDGRVSPDTLPARLRLVCPDPGATAQSLTRSGLQRETRRAFEAELDDQRLLSAAQVSRAAALIEAAAAPEPPGETDPQRAALAAGIFERCGSGVKSALFEQRDGFALLRVLCLRPPETAPAGLEEKLGVRFAPPLVTRCEGEGTLLSFYEAPPLSVSFARAAQCAPGERYCGDAAAGFFANPGLFYALLCDGMGTGEGAAIGSTLCCAMLRRLLKAGCGVREAVETANQALILSGAGETLAALDLARVDLYSGEVELYKAGAAATVLEKDRRAAVLEAESMPLGILRETSVRLTRFTLSPGDRLVLLSDGAAVLPQESCKSLLLHAREAGAQETASLFLDAALSCAAPADDRTAVCLRIEKAEKRSAPVGA